MAVPPSVPTSFVPRTQNAPRFSRLDLGGAYAFLAYGALLLAVASAAGVFLYGHYLNGVIVGEQKQIEEEQKKIDQTEVDSFISLNDRLLSGKQLLLGHTAVSGFFNKLETLTPTTVSFGSMSITQTEGHGVKLTAQGSARTFNSLAVLSGLLGKANQIQDAIFSGISVGKGGLVSFGVTANIEPALTTYAPGGTAPVTAQPVDTSTPSGEATTP